MIRIGKSARTLVNQDLGAFLRNQARNTFSHVIQGCLHNDLQYTKYINRSSRFILPIRDKVEHIAKSVDRDQSAR